ncbi:SAM-dependent methyltransferase [Brevundimonas sp.]|uniref:SAM-dependent methyltransferase n=1 Tax=Brevundimonas sp. TaxID=1871086 RepID=UPI003AF757C9
MKPWRYGWPMRMNFHRLAYEEIEVCNALTLETFRAFLEQASPKPGGRALEIGAGNAALAICLARDFGMEVEAVEVDMAVAALAQSRINAAGVEAQVTLSRMRSLTLLDDLPPQDLILCVGATDPVGEEHRHPNDAFRELAARLAPGGLLVWGDLYWTETPPEPLARVMALTNACTPLADWTTAAGTAGLEVLDIHIADDPTWDTYVSIMDAAARDWIAAHPDRIERPHIEATADRVRSFLTFSRPYTGFALQLMRKPAA